MYDRRKTRVMIRPRFLVYALVMWSGSALAGCPTVDQGDVPVPPPACRPDFVQFRDQIWPMAIAPADQAKSCVAQNGCHSRETGRSALRLIPMPASDQEFQMNYDVVTRFLNCNSPSSSSFITKPSSGADPHSGGDLWDPAVDPALLVETWIGGS